MASAQTLLDSSGCLACIPKGMEGAITIYLLQQINKTNMSADTLAANAACYSCIPDGLRSAVMIYLLDQINQGGGGGGGGSGVTCSASSDPSGVPTGNCGLWIRLDTGGMWAYNSGSAAWDKYL